MMAIISAAFRSLQRRLGLRLACPECRDPELRVVRERQEAVRGLLASVPVETDR